MLNTFENIVSVATTPNDDATIGRRACAFDALPAPAAVLDPDGVVVETNQAWRLFAILNNGPTLTTGVGVNYLDTCDRAALAGDTLAGEVAIGLRTVLCGERDRFDYEYPCPSPGEDRWFLMQAASAPVRDGAGAVVFHVDVTSRRLLQERLREEADQDPLTGLANRRAGRRFMGRLLKDRRQPISSVTVLAGDLDGFKEVNDSLGHAAGDQLLTQVRARAGRVLRDGDLLCRFGGDEFVLVCPDLPVEEAENVAARLEAAIAMPFQVGSTEVSVGISVGLAISRPDSTVDQLLAEADKAMYNRKVGKRSA